VKGWLLALCLREKTLKGFSAPSVEFAVLTGSPLQVLLSERAELHTNYLSGLITV